MKRTDYRHTGIVMLGLAAASLTGFLRQAALAHQLGAGQATDTYLVAFAVPEFIFVALPIVLSPAFIPLFAERRQEGGERFAWLFGLQVAGVLLGVLLLFTILGELLAPLYLRWLAPGFDPDQRFQAAQTTRVMLPAISLMGLATLAGAVLQVYRRFARPSLGTAVYNLVFIAVLMAVPFAQPLDRAGWGVLLGAAAALLLQVPLLWRCRPEASTRRSSRSEATYRDQGAGSDEALGLDTRPSGALDRRWWRRALEWVVGHGGEALGLDTRPSGALDRRSPGERSREVEQIDRRSRRGLDRRLDPGRSDSDARRSDSDARRSDSDARRSDSSARRSDSDARRSDPSARRSSRSEATYRDQGGLDRGSFARSVKPFVHMAGPLLAGYAVHHLILFVDRAMATRLGAGRAAALSYAYHLALAVGQLSGLAVSTAVFPRLAEEIAAGDTAGARADLSDALALVLAIGLPAAGLLIVLRTPIVSVLFEHGAFGQAATAAVTGPLRWYALAVLADALCQPLWRVVYAQRRPWIVFGVNAVQTGLRWTANVALTPLVGYNGLAISALIGLSVQAIALGWLARRWLGRYLTSGWWLDAARVLLGAGAAVALISLLLLPSSAGLEQMPATLKLVVGCTVGGAVYLLMLWTLKYRRRSWFDDWANRC